MVSPQEFIKIIRPCWLHYWFMIYQKAKIFLFTFTQRKTVTFSPFGTLWLFGREKCSAYLRCIAPARGGYVMYMECNIQGDPTVRTQTFSARNYLTFWQKWIKLYGIRSQRLSSTTAAAQLKMSTRSFNPARYIWPEQSASSRQALYYIIVKPPKQRSRQVFGPKTIFGRHIALDGGLSEEVGVVDIWEL